MKIYKEIPQRDMMWITGVENMVSKDRQGVYASYKLNKKNDIYELKNEDKLTPSIIEKINKFYEAQ